MRNMAYLQRVALINSRQFECQFFLGLRRVSARAHFFFCGSFVLVGRLRVRCRTKGDEENTIRASNDNTRECNPFIFLAGTSGVCVKSVIICGACYFCFVLLFSFSQNEENRCDANPATDNRRRTSRCPLDLPFAA